MSIIFAVWSPEAVANHLSSDENARPITALLCGLKDSKEVLKSGFPPFADSMMRMWPSSSPRAISELVLQLAMQKGSACGAVVAYECMSSG